MFFVLMITASITGYSQLALLNSEASSEGSVSTMSWDKKEHNFGKIVAGVPVTAEFVFTNEGKESFLVTNVKAPCGCTVSSYSEKAIQPGETGFIKATYNAAHVGAFKKGLTVYTNSGAEPILLNVKGEVIAAK